jgi:hypothetical protein
VTREEGEKKLEEVLKRHPETVRKIADMSRYILEGYAKFDILLKQWSYAFSTLITAIPIIREVWGILTDEGKAQDWINMIQESVSWGEYSYQKEEYGKFILFLTGLEILRLPLMGLPKTPTELYQLIRLRVCAGVEKVFREIEETLYDFEQLQELEEQGRFDVDAGANFISEYTRISMKNCEDQLILKERKFEEWEQEAKELIPKFKNLLALVDERDREGWVKVAFGMNKKDAFTKKTGADVVTRRTKRLLDKRYTEFLEVLVEVKKFIEEGRQLLERKVEAEKVKIILSSVGILSKE